MLVAAHTLTRQAYDEGYAVGAFNVSSLESMSALIGAAESAQSPALAMVWSGATAYLDFEGLSAALVSMAKRADVPISIHLDHSYSLDLISDALDLGFTSVMFDGSALSYEENVSKTRQARQMADRKGASLEGVIGEIGQENAMGSSAKPVEVQYTDPDQAVAYDRDTGVDLLAIAVGTQHGHYDDDVSLNVPLARTVSAQTKTPLVLHGGSYSPEDQVRQLIAAGVAKVNVATELEDAYLDGVRGLDLAEVRYTSELAGAGVEALQRCIEEKIRAFGSAGKA